MIDDDRAYSEMVVAYLREEGFQSQAVCSGMQALKIADAARFDVIILDVMMPGMSGHEVLRRLQTRNSGLAHLPVLMLTGCRAAAIARLPRSSTLLTYAWIAAHCERRSRAMSCI